MKSIYRFKCKYHRCPNSFIAKHFLERHEKKLHHECSKCGRMFVSLSKHTKHAERGNGGCVEKDTTAGTLTVY